MFNKNNVKYAQTQLGIASAFVNKSYDYKDFSNIPFEKILYVISAKS